MNTEAMHKAALQFANQTITEEREEAVRQMRDPRPGIMGAKLYHHPEDPDGVMRQYILKNAIGVSYEQPFDDLPTYQPEIIAPLFPKLLKSARPNDRFRGCTLPPLDELKQRWKWAQERWSDSLNPNTKYKLFHSDDEPESLAVIVDIRMLIGLMMLTGCEGGEAFYFINYKSPVLLEGDGAEGILMPLRTLHFNDCLNSSRYNAEFRRWKVFNA